MMRSHKPWHPPLEIHWRVHWYGDRFVERVMAESSIGEHGLRQASPAATLSILLLCYARDGFAGLRLAIDIAALADRMSDVPDGSEILAFADDDREIRPALVAALAVARNVVGLDLGQSIPPLTSREDRATRLANWRLAGDADQVRATTRLVDALLAPARSNRRFVSSRLRPFHSPKRNVIYVGKTLLRWLPALVSVAWGRTAYALPHCRLTSRVDAIDRLRSADLGSFSADPNLVSVVIAVQDDAAGLAATLDALRAQTMPRDRMEVIVVDDGSRDGSAPCAAEREPWIRLLRLPTSQGSYAARNEGLRHARGAVIAITDADCRPHPDWLVRGAARLRESPRTIVAGHLSMPLGPTPRIAAMVDVVHHLDQERYVGKGVAVTANLFAPCAAFEEVGGFNTALRSGGDFEWCRRARTCGWSLVFHPDVRTVHPPRHSARALIAKSKRVAVGGRRQVHQGLVPSGRRPYLSPRAVVPPHRSRGLDRVRANGADPGYLRWLAVGIGQVALVQAPQAIFALRADIGALRARHQARRAARRH